MNCLPALSLGCEDEVLCFTILAVSLQALLCPRCSARFSSTPSFLFSSTTCYVFLESSLDPPSVRNKLGVPFCELMSQVRRGPVQTGTMAHTEGTLVLPPLPFSQPETTWGNYLPYWGLHVYWGVHVGFLSEANSAPGLRLLTLWWLLTSFIVHCSNWDTWQIINYEKQCNPSQKTPNKQWICYICIYCHLSICTYSHPKLSQSKLSLKHESLTTVIWLKGE